MNQLAAIAKVIRPRQWLKNILLLSGLYFPDTTTGTPLLFSSHSIGRAVGGFLVFCAVASSIYILNDILDAARDRLHPKKKSRPIASGALDPGMAGAAGVVLAALGLGGAYSLSPAFFCCALAYFGMMVFYSLMLKDVFLIDVMIISMGFIIRAVSGVIVLRDSTHYVDLTPWFVICVLFLSLFLAFCKRRGEIIKLADEAHNHRRVLREYSAQTLDIGIGVSATAAILAYALYATNHAQPWMMLTTLPFVIFGVFRYLRLVYAHHAGDAPEDALLGDPTLMGCIVLWGLALLLVFYPR